MRLDVCKAQFVQIDGIYKGVNHAHHVVLGDQFIQRGSEKAKLEAVLSGSVCHVFSGCSPGDGDVSKIMLICTRRVMGRAFFTT